MVQIMFFALKLAGLLFALLLMLAVLFVLCLGIWIIVDSTRKYNANKRALAESKQKAYKLFEAAIAAELGQPPAVEVSDEYVDEGLKEIAAVLSDHFFNMRGRLDDSDETGNPS
jgi:hypothetical protein